MTRALWPALCFCALLLSACTARWPATRSAVLAQSEAPPVRAVAHLAQLGHGRSASFAWCEGVACPQVTPKTFAPHGGDATPGAAPGATLGLPDAPRSVAAAPLPASAPAPEADEVRVTVFFRFGDATLTPVATAALDAAASRAGAAHRLHIVGRTDSVGAQAVNDALAKARAHAVRDHLRKRLANWPATVDIESAGACCFAASNATAQGREANRRVEVTLSAAEPEELL